MISLIQFDEPEDTANGNPVKSQCTNSEQINCFSWSPIPIIVWTKIWNDEHNQKLHTKRFVHWVKSICSLGSDFTKASCNWFVRDLCIGFSEDLRTITIVAAESNDSLFCNFAMRVCHPASSFPWRVVISMAATRGDSLPSGRSARSGGWLKGRRFEPRRRHFHGGRQRR